MATSDAYNAGSAHLTISPELAADFESQVNTEVAKVNPDPIKVGIGLDPDNELKKQADAAVDAVQADLAGLNVRLDADWSTFATEADSQLAAVQTTLSATPLQIELDANWTAFAAEAVTGLAAIQTALQATPLTIPARLEFDGLDELQQRINAIAIARDLRIPVTIDPHWNGPIPPPPPGPNPGPNPTTQPNLDEFQRDLQARLRRIAADAELQIPLSADGERFRDMLRLMVAGAETDIHAEISADVTIAAGQRERMLDSVNEIEREIRRNGAIEIPVETNLDAFQTDLQSRLRQMQRDAEIRIPLTPQGEDFRQRLRGLVEQATRNIEADIPIDPQLAAAQRAQLLAEIERIERQIEINVPVDVDSDDLDEVKDKSDRAGRSLNLMGAVKFSALLGGIGAIGGALTGLIGLAGGAAAGLGALAGVGVVGSTGLVDAFQAQGAATDSATTDGQDLEDQRRQAADAVADAQWGVAEANRGVAAAERDAAQAQEALNRAYKDASRELRDMNDQLQNAELSQEGAALAVARARENVNRVNSSSKSSDLDKQEADYQLRVQEARYAQSKTATSDIRQDVGEANAKGVTGSSTVQDARQGMSDAQQGVADANHQAELAARALADAERDLARAGESAGAGQDKLAEALAKLSPNARDFFEQMVALGPAWKELRLAVQDNMFAGLGDSVTNLANNQLPGLKAGMSTMATQLNTALKETISTLDSTLTSLVDSGAMKGFVDGFGQMMTGMAPMVGGITTAFVEMGARVMPALGPLFTSLGDMIGSLGPALGDIGRIMAETLTAIMPTLGQFIEALAVNMAPILPILGQLLITFGQALIPLLPAISEIAQVIGEALLDAVVALEPALGPLMDALSGAFQALLPAIAPLGEALASLVVALAPFLPVIATVIAQLVEALAPALTVIFDALQPVIGQWLEGMLPVFNKLAPILADVAMQLGTAIASALDQLMPLLPTLIDSFSRIVLALAPFIPQLVEIAIDLFPSIVGLLTTLVEVALPPFTAAIEFLAVYVFPLVIEGIRLFADTVGDKFDFAKAVVEGAKTNIGGAVQGMKDFFTGLGETVGRVWDGIVDKIADATMEIGKLLQKAGGAKMFGVSVVPGGDKIVGLGNDLVNWGAANQHADGGHISGPGGPRDDLIPAYLSNGEFVVNAAATAQYAPLLEAINSGSIPAFANGGIVGGDVQWGPSGIDQSIWEAVSSQFGSAVTVTSAYRPGHSGHHGKGSGVDIVGPFQEVADWVYNTYPGMSQLIWGPGPLLYGGVDPSDQAQLRQIYADDLSGHFDHVHIGNNAPIGPPGPAVEIPEGGPTEDWSKRSDGGTNDTSDSAQDELNASTDSTASQAVSDGSEEASSSEPKSFSDIAATAASAAASGYVSDTLGLFGIPDSPYALQAYSLYMEKNGPKKDDKDKPSNKDQGKSFLDMAGGAVTPAAPSDSATAPSSSTDSLTAPSGTDTPSSMLSTPTAPDSADKGSLSKARTDENGEGAGKSGSGKSRSTKGESNPFDHIYDPNLGVDQWAGVVDAVLSFGGWPSSFRQPTLGQMDIESDGNPTITNPSFNEPGNGGVPTGLMQVVPNTFNAFKSPGLLDSITDPANNIFAAINYVMTDPKFNGRGVGSVWPTTAGYAEGGSVWGPGGPTEDAIPAWLSDREFVMNAKSADANRPLLEAMNRDANVIESVLAPRAALAGARAVMGAGLGSSTSVDQSMQVHISTPDVDTAFQKAKAWETARGHTYTGRWR